MARPNHGEAIKWASIALIVLNLLIWQAIYLRRRDDDDPRAPPPAAEVDYAALSFAACPPQLHRTVKVPCPPIECTAAEKRTLQAQADTLQSQLIQAQQEAGDAKTAADTSIAELQAALADAVARQREPAVRLSNPQVEPGSVLILTPAKNAVEVLRGYFDNLQRLTYPRELLSLGFIVSDSLDHSAREVRAAAQRLDGDPFAGVLVLQRDYGYSQAPDPNKVMTPDDEQYRRSILARSRNYLLSYALRNQEWVLWLDVDIVWTPPTLIEDLLATRENIVTTDCVYLDDMGEPTGRHCDGNSWAETDASRKYLKTADPAKPLFLEYGGDEAFRDSRLRLSKMAPPASPALARMPDTSLGAGEADTQETDEPNRVAPVPLDGVGGHVLLVRADVHREGFVFPSVLYDHQVETEGFAKMAKALGHQPYGLPGYVVHHAHVTVKPQPTWDRRLL